MDFGVTSKLWEYGINSHTSAIAEKNVDGSFAEIAAAKAAEKVADKGNAILSYDGCVQNSARYMGEIRFSA